MMLVQKKILFHIAYILVFMYSETCLIRTLCSKVTAGPTCESSNVLPQGCDEFSVLQIRHLRKKWQIFSCIVFNARLSILQVQGTWS